MCVLDRGVQSGGQRAEVSDDLGRVLEAHLAGRRQPGDEHPCDRFEGVGAVGHELLEHRDGGRLALLEHDLGIATEAWHGRELGLLAEEGGHLEVRVEAGLEPSVGLQQQRVAEHDRRM